MKIGISDPLQRLIASASSACCLSLLTVTTHANFVIETSVGAEGRKAEASFTQNGTELTLTLSNVGGEISDFPGVLTGFFFSLPTTITPISAELGEGSFVFYAPDLPSDWDGTLGGEWAYKEGVLDYDFGVAGAGFDIFGPTPQSFPGADLDGKQLPDGPGFGIVSALDNLSLGNAQVTGQFPLIRNSIKFTFTLGRATELVEADVSAFRFQYGTALDEGNYSGGGGDGGGGWNFGVPDSATTLMLLGLAFTGLAGMRRRVV